MFRSKFKNKEELQGLVNLEYLNKISDVFQDFSDKTLFGLDYIYDFTNKIYYLIDCNNFPGYKELDKEFNTYLTRHVLFFYDKHLKSLENMSNVNLQIKENNLCLDR